MEMRQITPDKYLDPLGRCIVNSDDSRVFLTQMEFLILHHFTNRPNTVLYTQDIINAINASHKVMFSEQNLYVYIRKLRIKLEDNYKKPNFLINIKPGYILNVAGNVSCNNE